MSGLFVALASAVFGMSILFPWVGIASLLIWLPFANFFPPLLYNLFSLGLQPTRDLILLKDCLLAAAIGGSLLRNRHWFGGLKTPDLLALAYALVLLPYLLMQNVDGVSLSTRLLSFRELLTPPLAYLAGRLIVTVRLKSLLRVLISMHAVVCVFGIIEWLFFPLQFWSLFVGVGAYLVEVKGLIEGYNAVDGLFGNHVIRGVRRMVSFYTDPHSLGQSSVLPLMLLLADGKVRGISLFRNGLSRGLLIALFSVALVMTIHRESILAVSVGAAVLVARSQRASWGNAQGWQAAGALGFVALFAMLTLVALGPDLVRDTLTGSESSAAMRLDFLRGATSNPSNYILGLGVGAAGGAAFSEGVRVEGIGENSYLSLLAQAGIVSLALLLGFLGTAAGLLWRGSLREAVSAPISASLLAGIVAALIGRCVGALFSESLFGFTGSVPLFFFVGAGIRFLCVSQPVENGSAS